jgi:kinesin family protein 2/24
VLAVVSEQAFEFDHSFNEEAETETVYHYVCQPLVHFVCSGGRATCFAYGQTGSGKTHTMVLFLQGSF